MDSSPVTQFSRPDTENPRRSQISGRWVLSGRPRTTAPGYVVRISVWRSLDSAVRQTGGLSPARPLPLCGCGRATMTHCWCPRSRPLTASALALPQTVLRSAARTILYTMVRTPSSCAPAFSWLPHRQQRRSEPSPPRTGPEPPPCAPVSCSPPPSASCLRQGHSLVPQLPLAGMSSSSMASLFPPAVPPGLYPQVTISKSSSLILDFITLHTALVLLSPSVSLSLFHSSPLYPSASDIWLFTFSISFDAWSPPPTLSISLEHGWANFYYKRPDSEYFWLCGPCGFLSQLLNSAIIYERSHWQYRVPIKLYLQKQVASTRFGPRLIVCHPCSRIITSVSQGLNLIYSLFYPHNFEAVWYKVVPQ